MVNAEHGFNSLAYGRIKSEISAVATTIELEEGSVYAFLPGWSSTKEMYLTLADAYSNVEVVKVTAISGNFLTVERGQDGSTARTWYAGTYIGQRLVASNLDRFLQKATERSITFNPNGILLANYPGEEVLQTGLEACQNRWWKSTTGRFWRLIAGIMCAYDWTDENGYIFTAYPLYAYCGSSGSRLQDTDEYDPDTWTQKTDAPLPARQTPCALNLRLVYGYIFGGAGPGYLLDTDEYYLDVWDVKTNLPAPARSTAACADADEYGYVFGGDDGVAGDFSIDDTDEYDSASDAWASKTAMNMGSRQGLGAASYDNVCYVGGGLTLGQKKAEFSSYDPDTWTAETEQYGGAYVSMAYIAIEGNIYTIAGIDSVGDRNETEKFTVGLGTWEAKSNIPSPSRSGLGGGTFADEGYICGGLAGARIADTDKYVPDTWSSVSDMPAPNRNIHGFAAADSR